MKRIMLVMLLILMVPNCIGFTATKFNNLLQNENVTIQSTSNITRYLTLPTNAQIVNMTLNLTPRSNSVKCYQEYANVSETCGALSSGTYAADQISFEFSPFFFVNASNMLDGDYDTYGLINLSYSPGVTTFDINYTIPANAVNYNTTWQIKGHNGTSTVTSNYTIPQKCWDYAINNSRILEVFVQTFAGGTNITAWRCRDGTSSPPVLEILGDGAQGRENNRIYEEAMYWNIVTHTSKVTQDPADDYVVESFISTTRYYNYSYKYNSIGAVINYSKNGAETLLNLPLRCFESHPIQIKYLQGTTDTISCYNGTAFEDLDSVFGADSIFYYNNSYAWNVSDILNPKLDIGNDNDYEWQYSGIFNVTTGTNNYTNLQSIIESGCTCTSCNLTDGLCTVPFVFTSNTTSTLGYSNLSVEYTKSYNLSLINEFTGEYLNIADVTSAKIYETNLSVINLKTLGANNITLNFSNTSSFWVELQYEDNSIITRWIDVAYVPDQDLRVCGNPQNTTHFEQIITSVSEIPVRIYSTFAGCYIAADTTRFAYTTQQSLKAYTVDQEYDLEIFRNNQWQDLVGLEGTIQTEINIDTILFAQTQYDISTVGESISINTLYPTNTTVQIYYINSKEDNINVLVTIENLDTGTVVYTSSSFDNINNITIFYDYSLDTYDINTLYKVTVTKTDATGEKQLIAYFNTQGKTGILPAELAFAISVGILFFGFTFFVASLSLSWLGLVMTVLSMGVLSFSVPTFYTKFLLGIEAIIFIFIILVLTIQKPGTVAS